MCGMASLTIAVTSVHKTLSGLNRRSGRDDVRGVGDALCFVRVHRSSYLLPVSLPVLLPITGLTQSHSITVLGAENAGSTEGKLSLSHTIIIHRTLLRWFF